MAQGYKDILWGVGLVLLYILALQPLFISILYRLLQRISVGRGGLRFDLTALAISLLLLPFALPAAFALVRAFYGMMAIANIQKLVSYWNEGGPRGAALDSKAAYLDFMNGLTTNYWEQPAPLAVSAEKPDPRKLRLSALFKIVVLAAAVLLNVRFRLWTVTPPLAATLVKSLLFVVFLWAQRDLVHAALIAKGLKPDIQVVDLRLFVSDTYEKVLLRLNPTTHRWLLRYVYLPLGGNQNRVRNTLLSYGLSGLWHEYLLVAASMTLTGLWFAYFAVNGVIVSLEPFAGSVRGALLSGFAPASIAHRTLSRAVQLLNFLLNVLVAHLMFRGLELVVEFH
jgi:hypothetical protein